MGIRQRQRQHKTQINKLPQISSADWQPGGRWQPWPPVCPSMCLLLPLFLPLLLLLPLLVLLLLHFLLPSSTPFVYSLLHTPFFYSLLPTPFFIASSSYSLPLLLLLLPSSTSSSSSSSSAFSPFSHSIWVNDILCANSLWKHFRFQRSLLQGPHVASGKWRVWHVAGSISYGTNLA